MFDDESPIYQQIADRIRDDVVAGTLRPGDQVMSTTQYATFHRINPATAGKAFQQLVDEGVLEKRRGIGMFVTEAAPEMLRSQRRSTFAERLVDPLVAEARRLGMDPKEVLDIVRTRLTVPGGDS